MSPCTSKQYRAILDLTDMLVKQNDLTVQEKDKAVDLAKTGTLSSMDAWVMVGDMGMVASPAHYDERTRATAMESVKKILNSYV